MKSAFRSKKSLSRSSRAFWAAGLLVPLILFSFRSPQGDGPQGDGPEQDSTKEALESSFAENGIALDLERKRCSIAANIGVRDDLLEFVVVGRQGALHESLLSTEVTPSLLNAALLTLGAEPGINARETMIDPAPTAEEIAKGAPTHELHAPEGDGFYLYVGWREGEEEYFFRIEDLIRNLISGRSMKRHAWVFLGSRTVEVQGETKYAADIFLNVISVAFFRDSDTLITSATPMAVYQDIWMPNAWLLPERGAEVRLVLSREPILSVDEELRALLPKVESAAQDADLPSGARLRSGGPQGR